MTPTIISNNPVCKFCILRLNKCNIHNTLQKQMVLCNVGKETNQMSLLVLCLFLLYRLLNMFRATLCPSSGADDL